MNPFNERLKEFYYSVVSISLESDDTKLVKITQDLLRTVCVDQFIKSQDELNGIELAEQDEWGLDLFRSIFTYFEPSLKM